MNVHLIFILVFSLSLALLFQFLACKEVACSVGLHA
jgi:hypothetical protein